MWHTYLEQHSHGREAVIELHGLVDRVVFAFEEKELGLQGKGGNFREANRSINIVQLVLLRLLEEAEVTGFGVLGRPVERHLVERVGAIQSTCRNDLDCSISSATKRSELEQGRRRQGRRRQGRRLGRREQEWDGRRPEGREQR